MIRYLAKNEEHSSKTLAKKSLTARGVITRSYNDVLQRKVIFAVSVWFDTILQFVEVIYQLTIGVLAEFMTSIPLRCVHSWSCVLTVKVMRLICILLGISPVVWDGYTLQWEIYTGGTCFSLKRFCCICSDATSSC